MPSWSYLDHPGPIAFAHRGGALDAPENSLEAFVAASELGYRYAETDVHLTADGYLIAFHDTVLDRVTDGRGVIAELTLAEVRQARIDGVAEIPLLSDLLEELPDMRFNIDPKVDESAAPLAELITAMGVADRVCVGSFSDRRIAVVAELVGNRLCTGMGPRSVVRLRSASLGVRVRAPQQACAQVPTQTGRVTLVTERFVDAAHRMGKVVHVWTIDEPDEMHRLLDMGVDGIMTDRPVVLRSVLQERGQW